MSDLNPRHCVDVPKISENRQKTALSLSFRTVSREALQDHDPISATSPHSASYVIIYVEDMSCRAEAF